MSWTDIAIWASLALGVLVIAAAMGHALWKATEPPPTIPPLQTHEFSSMIDAAKFLAAHNDKGAQ